MLNNSGGSEHHCLVPDLRGNTFSFSLLRIMFCCGLVTYGLYCVEVGSFCAHFLKSFNHKWVLDFVRLFVFLLDWSLDHYVVSFLISCNLLYFKVYFVWYEDCYSSFLLLPICMKYIFPSPHFQSVCIFRSEVDFL